MRDVIKKIPFDAPVGEPVHLDFSNMAVPYYVKSGFKVSVFCVDDSHPVDASCCIYSPQKTVTVIILIKRKFEKALEKWQTNQNGDVLLVPCCRRRELYCHETSHLIAIIRAFPSDRLSKTREDFIAKLREKFNKSVSDAGSPTAIPLISQENADDSPSVFDKDHFRYQGDDLNYFRLYAELMFDYDTMRNTLKKFYDAEEKEIYLEDISRATLVPTSFFQIFPDKIAVLREILKAGFD
jgi:hypothetical protein